MLRSISVYRHAVVNTPAARWGDSLDLLVRIAVSSPSPVVVPP